MNEAGLLGAATRDGFTLISGFLLEIGFGGWPTPSDGVGVGILSTRISGGAFGTVESGIGPLAGISCALVAKTRVEGSAGPRLAERFAGTERGIRAGSGGMFALWKGEPWGN